MKYLGGVLVGVLALTSVPLAAISQVVETYTLTPVSTEVALGESVEIAWEADNGASSRDWIGIYKASDSDRSYIAWDYLEDGGTSGSIRFDDLPVGVYNARYFLNNGFDRVAVSEDITVMEGPSVDFYAVAFESEVLEPDDTIVVTWDAPLPRASSNDWVGLFEVGDSDRSYIAWDYISNSTNSGSVVFNAQNPGRYEARMFINNSFDRVAVSDTLTVEEDGQPPSEVTYTLTVEKEEYNVGENSRVSWEVTGSPDIDFDWVGLYPVGASDISYLEYEYIDAYSGSALFKLDDEGEFEYRYFTHGTYNQVASSEPFNVVRDDSLPEEYTLVTDKSEYLKDDTIVVSWDVRGADTIRNDWIGMYEVGASDRSYLTYHYVDESSGDMTFTAREVGEYEFRYFKNNSYSKVVTTDPISVVADTEPPIGGSYTLEVDKETYTPGEQSVVTWATPPRVTISGDWIGLYRVGASDRSYETYEYVESRTGSMNFRLSKEGDFEYRYFKNNGYERVAVSEVVTVADEVDPEPPVEGEYRLLLDRAVYGEGDTVTVSWTAPANENLSRDWIAMYRPSDSNRSYISWTYTDASLEGSTNFTAPDAGEYEFRYLKNNRYEDVAVSDRFVVEDAVAGPVCNGIELSSVTNYPNTDGPVVALGDSLTLGVGASSGLDWVSLLEDRLNVPIDNQGVSGDTTQDALERLERDVLSKNPSTVIVFLGGNDELRRFYEELLVSGDAERKEQLDMIAMRLGYDYMDVPLMTRSQSFANLKEIVERIQATGATTIVVGVDAGIFDAVIEAEYERVAEETGSVLVPDIYSGIFGRPSRMFDLVHPNNVGHMLFADRIEPSLECLVE